MTHTSKGLEFNIARHTNEVTLTGLDKATNAFLWEIMGTGEVSMDVKMTDAEIIAAIDAAVEAG